LPFAVDLALISVAVTLVGSGVAIVGSLVALVGLGVSEVGRAVAVVGVAVALIAAFGAVVLSPVPSCVEFVRPQLLRGSSPFGVDLALVVECIPVRGPPTVDYLVSDVDRWRAALPVRGGGGSFGSGQAPIASGVFSCPGHVRTHAIMDLGAALEHVRDGFGDAGQCLGRDRTAGRRSGGRTGRLIRVVVPHTQNYPPARIWPPGIRP
jgi:hypothetical protein